jgi:hypothetical protein
MAEPETVRLIDAREVERRLLKFIAAYRHAAKFVRKRGEPGTGIDVIYDGVADRLILVFADLIPAVG